MNINNNECIAVIIKLMTKHKSCNSQASIRCFSITTMSIVDKVWSRKKGLTVLVIIESRKTIAERVN
jgi:hypothetical protein